MVKRASNFEKTVRVQTSQAIEGDHRAARNVNDYAKQAGPYVTPAPTEEGIKLSKAEEQIMQLIRERLFEVEPGNKDEMPVKSESVPNSKGKLP